MSAEAPAFSRAEKEALAVKAVNRLIADVEAKRLLENKELDEVIKVCIRETPQGSPKSGHIGSAENRP